MTLLKYIVGGVVLLGAFGYWFVSQTQMDPLMTEARKKKIEASPHYVNGEFIPIHPH